MKTWKIDVFCFKKMLKFLIKASPIWKAYLSSWIKYHLFGIIFIAEIWADMNTFKKFWSCFTKLRSMVIHVIADLAKFVLIRVWMAASH